MHLILIWKISTHLFVCLAYITVHVDDAHAHKFRLSYYVTQTCDNRDGQNSLFYNASADLKGSIPAIRRAMDNFAYCVPFRPLGEKRFVNTHLLFEKESSMRSQEVCFFHSHWKEVSPGFVDLAKIAWASQRLPKRGRVSCSQFDLSRLSISSPCK